MLDAKGFLQNLSTAPGVYRMFDAGDETLYVGKARNLKKRLASYFRVAGLAPRTQALMAQVARVDVTVTHTENEALLLENNLIKSLQPRYNVLLRDDKSYPYIYLDTAHAFPRLSFHRGARKGGGRYFGPFPSSTAVRESLSLLQKVFRLRPCEDSFFRNRSRPCLQHQIGRCSAPCVGRIAPAAYAEDVRQAVLFLDGKNQALVTELVQRMERAAEARDYEAAAAFRDRIALLRQVMERQYVSGEKGGDVDVIAVYVKQDRACVAVMYIRGGRNLGSKAFFPSVALETDPAQVLAAFLPQYYLGKSIPGEIIVNADIPEPDWLCRVFAAEAHKKVNIASRVRGARARWLRMAALNAADALRRRLAGQATLRARFEALQEALALDAPPERIECFDISHTMGEATVAACVVFDQAGPVKADYRRFNIEGVAPGDDYGAIRQALTRRYKRYAEGESRLPDLLLIDGGKGQLGVAEGVLDEMQVAGVRSLAVAKGVERKPGREQLFLSAHAAPTILAADSPALHLIQQIRDEAHRFAITGHRQRRGKARMTSTLEQIPGIGDRRRQALLKNLGGLQGVARAGVEDLAGVPGISMALAQRIYELFHGTGD